MRGGTTWAWKRGNHVQEQVLKGLLQVTVLSAWFQVSTPFWLSQLNTHYPSLRGVKSSTVWESQLEVCEASDKGFSSSDRRRETWLAFYVLPSFSLEFRRTAFLNGAAAAILWPQKKSQHSFDELRTTATYLQILIIRKKKKIISLVKPLLSGLTYFGTEHFPRWYRYQAQNYMFQILKASPWKQTTERQREFHLFYIWVVQGLAQLIFLMLLLSRLQRDWIEFYKHWFRLDCMFPSNKERESFPLFPEQSALNFLEWFFTFQIMTVLFT